MLTHLVSNQTISNPIVDQPDYALNHTQQGCIDDLARRCFIELAVSLTIGTAVLFFTATPLAGALLFSAIAAQTVCNSVIRYLDHQTQKGQGDPYIKWISSLCLQLCPTVFSWLTAFNGQMLVKEIGRAMTVGLLFRKASPKITITPFFSSLTQATTIDLTSIGKLFGQDNALLLVTLMGPVSTLFVSAIAIAISRLVSERWPVLSSYCSNVGSGDFYTHIFYALTALSDEPPSLAGEFVQLALYGIHPIVSASALLAIHQSLIQ